LSGSGRNDEQGHFSHYKARPDDTTSLSNNIVHVIHEDKFGQLWVGTDEGLNVLRTDRKTFYKVKSVNGKEGSLSHNRVLSIYQDEENIFWIGTINGLNKWNSNQRKFNHVKLHASDLHDDKSITDFAERKDGSILIATYGAGLHVYDRNSNITSAFSKNDLLSDDRVSTVLVDKNDNIWVGTRGTGLSVFDHVSQTMRYYSYEAGNDQSLPSEHVSDIFEDKEGDIWIATYKGGLSRLIQGKGPLINYQQNTSVLGRWCSNRILDIHQDNRGLLWLATENGINRFDPKSQTSTCFQHKKNSSESLSSNISVYLYEDSKGNFWIATFGGGLNLWRKEDRLNGIDRFQVFATDEGLLSNNIYAILEDDTENIWLSSNKGLSRLNAKTLAIDHFNPSDGLQGYEYYFSSALKTQAGELIFGGKKGFNIFQPETIEGVIDPPNVILTNILKLNKPLASFHPYGRMTSVNFDYSDYLITFEFVGFNYIDSKRNHYQYQLEGFDSDWIDSGTINRATYTNVPPGNYVFKVKSSNAGHQWSQDYIQLEVTITAALWNTWWAHSLYWLGGLGLLFVLTWLVYQRKIAEKAKQTALTLAAAKEDLFASISHEFRTPLTLIAGPANAIRNLTREKKTQSSIELVIRNTHRLIVMVDQILDFMRLREGNTQPRQVKDVVAVTRFITQCFQPLLDEKQISLSLINREDGPIWVSMIPDALEKIVINFVSNAYKYTANGGTIEIDISLEAKGGVKLDVTDSGCGINQDDLPYIFDRFTRLQTTENSVTGTGVGLALVKELVEIHGGSIDVVSGLNLGSTFTVRLPLLLKQELEQEQQKASLLSGDTAKAYIDKVIEILRPGLSMPSGLDVPDESVGGPKKPVVLVVDDNPDMRHYLADILSSRYQCYTASDGVDALDQALDIVPDLIISDVMMPRMNGYELACKLKSNDTSSHIPLILLTAKGDKKNRIRGWQENVDEYLCKPFDAEELIFRIGNLLAIRASLQQYYSQSLSELAETPSCHSSCVGKAVISDQTSKDQHFIDRLNGFLEEHISDPQLKVTTVAQSFYMTEKQLSRKLKALINITPGDYIRSYRLQKASLLLAQRRTVGDVAYSVGFSSQSNFSRCFKSKYGFSPTHYREIKSRDLKNGCYLYIMSIHYYKPSRSQ
jgi:signal transduction histidine kinase/ligand-binding sensor domain-containing protein/DNA-binding response OmpR family regulator